MTGDDTSLLRIGELSQRVGVSDHVLRAWERRYGVPSPVRTGGGFRLYSEVDVARIRRMQQLVSEGVAPAEAARAVNAAPAPASASDLEAMTSALVDALEGMDEPRAQDLLDELFARQSVESAIRDVVLPCLHTFGDRWADGGVTVAQEHFATQVLRGRLFGLARGWGRGFGPRVLLACPAGEQHDVGLLAFGVALSRRGYAITYLGADTPDADLARTVEVMRPAAVVLAVTHPQKLAGTVRALTKAGAPRILLAGAAAGQAVARGAKVQVLAGDPVTAAAQFDA